MFRARAPTAGSQPRTRRHACLASSFLTSSTALVKSWTTWNQSAVTEADLNFCSTAERNAGDMSQTTSTMFSGRPLWAPGNARNRVKHSLALAGSREDHGLVGTVRVDEDGDVVVFTPGHGLIQTDGLEFPEVQRSDGLGHMVANNAPQAGIRYLNVRRDGIDRHLSNEAHDNLLEKQGKTAALPGPWGFDTSDSMPGATEPRQSSHEVSVMLEEVEMPPREFPEVVSLARGSAPGTRIQRSAVGTNLQGEP